MSLKVLPALFVLCVGIAGCGPSKVNVDGNIVNGGQPFSPKDDYLTVNLTSEDGSVSANGKVNAEGKFTIETIDNAGLLPGKYKVSLVRYRSLAATGGKPPTPTTLNGNEVWDVSSSNRTFTIDIAKYK